MTVAELIVKLSATIATNSSVADLDVYVKGCGVDPSYFELDADQIRTAKLVYLENEGWEEILGNPYKPNALVIQ